MATQYYDIVFAGDFREPSFRSTTTTDQLQAVTTAGYKTGLLQLTTERENRPTRIHQDVRDLIDRGRVAHLDPDQAGSAKLLIATEPALFSHRPRRALSIDATASVVLIPQVPFTRTGREPYDWTSIHRHASEVLGADVFWAPMSPLVREQLEQLDPRPRITERDWHACIDSATWRLDRQGYQSSRPVLGRSAAHDEDVWPNQPNEILSLYPDDPRFLVRILNGGPALRKAIGPYPRNWEVLNSSEVSELDFLSSIDFFVHSHHPDRATSIDASLLRAMAGGAVAILPPSLEPAFGDAAVYAEPQQVMSRIWQLYTNRSHYTVVSKAGARIIEERFGPKGLLDRIGALIGPPERKSDGPVDGNLPTGVRAPRARRRVMFITINGVGMGHLTRMLAIAKRCPEPIEPVFVTMSQALKVLREQGYLAEFIPSRQYLGCDINQWNAFLRDELNEMLSFYDPAIVVFDGNVPYQGLIDAIKTNEDPWFVWSRRGMWRSDNADIVGRERYFDIVLEPGDLAAADDHGITTRHRDRSHQVKPIRLLDEPDMLSRSDARKELGLDLEKPAVLIQLGAGNNFDYRSIHRTALAHIDERYDADVAVGEWLISDQPSDLPDNIVRMPGYPFARFFKAFDFAISAVGYNSFHELLFAGIPTIFVPNEAMQQDNQLARALYADRQGLAICVRSKEVYRLTATIDRLFLPEERERLKSRLSDLNGSNGAAEVAELIEEMAYSRRVDRA